MLAGPHEVYMCLAGSAEALQVVELHVEQLPVPGDVPDAVLPAAELRVAGAVLAEALLRGAGLFAGALERADAAVHESEPEVLPRELLQGLVPLLLLRLVLLVRSGDALLELVHAHDHRVDAAVVGAREVRAERLHVLLGLV